MPLVTWNDLHRSSVTVPSERVFERVWYRTHDANDPMPPPPGELLPEELALLEAWLRAGAPAGDTTSCSPPGAGGQGGGGPGTGGGASTGGSGGTGNPPGTGGAGGGGGDGGVVNRTCTPVNFVAHGRQAPADPTPFDVAPNAQNLYQCFYFKAPWNAPVHGLTFKSVIDNSAVIHHWLLYASNTARPDGASEPCLGVHADASLLAGWAPGADDWIMPPSVGMELPYGPTGNLVLEIHYNNGQAKPGLVDRSGVEVCATEELQPNAATVSWLGTELIGIQPLAQGTAQGTCTPQHSGPIQVLRSWPHMHKLGTALKTDILRAGGAVENLVDVPSFAFDYQYGYVTPAVINPGDKLVTTCSYQNTTAGAVLFGPATENEMCYNFVVAYPANALKSGGLMTRSCMF